MRAPPPVRSPILVRLLRVAILSLILLSLLAMLLAGGAWTALRALEGRVAFGLRVGGLALDGMTRDEALAALDAEYSAAEKVVYTFIDGERTWTATATDLGLRFPAEQLVERAYAIGHSGELRTDLQELARAWLDGVDLPAHYEFDESAALAYLRRLAAEINRERRDATLRIDGLHVAIDEGESGRRLDVAATLPLARESVLSGQGETIALVVQESPPRAWNLSETAQLVHTALSAPIAIHGSLPNGEALPPWFVTRQQIRDMMTISLGPDGDSMRFDVAIDLRPVRAFLMSLAMPLSSQPVDSRLDFDPASGQLRALTPSAIGRSLDVDATMRLLEEAVFSRDNRGVDMIFVDLPPRFHEGSDAAELGIRELVSEATTYFWGSSQNRRDNIGLGVSKLHGIVVAPGEEFSFNRHLGEITAAAGYLEGSVILGGATVTGIGGGICQVSTTMYRAAFGGGFDITERNSHGYRVGYYEYAGAGPGLDAAIWQPHVDLRFLNDTPHHLLIESSYLPMDNALQFRIYSARHWTTRIGAPVISEVAPPPEDLYVAADDLLPGQIRQIDWSVAGADVVVERTVYDSAGGVAKRNRVFTRYAPWQAVYEVAAGDPRLPQEEDQSPDESGGG